MALGLLFPGSVGIGCVRYRTVLNDFLHTDFGSSRCWFCKLSQHQPKGQGLVTDRWSSARIWGSHCGDPGFRLWGGSQAPLQTCRPKPLEIGKPFGPDTNARVSGRREPSADGGQPDSREYRVVQDALQGSPCPAGRGRTRSRTAAPGATCGGDGSAAGGRDRGWGDEGWAGARSTPGEDGRQGSELGKGRVRSALPAPPPALCRKRRLRIKQCGLTGRGVGARGPSPGCRLPGRVGPGAAQGQPCGGAGAGLATPSPHRQSPLQMKLERRAGVKSGIRQGGYAGRRGMTLARMKSGRVEWGAWPKRGSLETRGPSPGSREQSPCKRRAGTFREVPLPQLSPDGSTGYLALRLALECASWGLRDLHVGSQGPEPRPPRQEEKCQALGKGAGEEGERRSLKPARKAGSGEESSTPTRNEETSQLSGSSAFTSALTTRGADGGFHRAGLRRHPGASVFTGTSDRFGPEVGQVPRAIPVTS
ncbi:unnamed protein product [Rangifer tarandus platyrhynchus]|uniref:Uncharacterized protein n=1 Tax=Rangifer tarandus platyrhynchus TaxID=3082113 RepID=A0ACB1MJR9_RANTA